MLKLLMLKLGVWMVRQMNDIEEKIDELFDELKNKDIYLNYIKAKKQLKSNNEVTNIINKIKRLQKICTNNDDPKLEDEIKELYDALNSYPIYQSYLNLKDLLNEELIIIKNQFENYFKDILKF